MVYLMYIFCCVLVAMVYLPYGIFNVYLCCVLVAMVYLMYISVVFSRYGLFDLWYI